MTDEKSPVFRIEEKTTTARVLDWAAGQPFNNVLLLIILGCIVWGGKFAVTVAIPAHLEQIQKGYESLTESHREERERTQQIYDRWLNKSGAEVSKESKVATQPVELTQ